MNLPFDSLIFFVKVTAWVNLFISLNEKLDGYGKVDITPYIHSMVYHVPQFMKLHKGMKQFSVQGTQQCKFVVTMLTMIIIYYCRMINIRLAKVYFSFVV